MQNELEIESQMQYFDLLKSLFKTGFLSEGKMLNQFELLFKDYMNGVDSLAVSGGGIALYLILKYLNLSGADVIVPTNTFMATPLAVQKAGGRVVFADCKKDDLCLGVDDVKKALTPKTKAVVVVHIGGHISFDVCELKGYCDQKGLYLIEDCAHAHGALYRGQRAGAFGFAGAYSFYATKTIPLGEGGMVVSSDQKFMNWLRSYRNYGKPHYEIEGFNHRMNEVTAALGIVQMERLGKILEWKRECAEKYDKIFNDRVNFPSDMQSGFYKYIVFNQEPKEQTGKVYETLCHSIMKMKGDFPVSQWLSKNHYSPPIYYRYESGELNIENLKRKLLN